MWFKFWFIGKLCGESLIFWKENKNSIVLRTFLFLRQCQEDVKQNMIKWSGCLGDIFCSTISRRKLGWRFIGDFNNIILFATSETEIGESLGRKWRRHWGRSWRRRWGTCWGRQPLDWAGWNWTESYSKLNERDWNSEELPSNLLKRGLTFDEFAKQIVGEGLKFEDITERVAREGLMFD